MLKQTVLHSCFLDWKIIFSNEEILPFFFFLQKRTIDLKIFYVKIGIPIRYSNNRISSHISHFNS